MVTAGVVMMSTAVKPSAFARSAFGRYSMPMTAAPDVRMPSTAHGEARFAAYS